jgi:hypothetical protein
VNNSLGHFHNLLRTIDALVLKISSPGHKVGEKLKALAAYEKELETIPVHIKTQRELLLTCANPEAGLVVEANKLLRRMRDNWEGCLRTDALLEKLRKEMSRKRHITVAVQTIESEIAVLVASNKERRATYLELMAQYVALAHVDHLNREALTIRTELKIVSLEQLLEEKLGELDEAIAFAEEVAMDLDQRAKRHQKAVEARAKTEAEAKAKAEAEAVAATVTIPGFENPDGSPIEFENVELDALPPITVHPAIDPDLAAYMKIEGLDPESPDDVALAMATADSGDLVAAREIFSSCTV